MIDTGWTLWAVILLLGAGTYLIRFSFLGLIGSRKLPDWVLRHLRYAPHAVLPGMIAPLVFWPQATGGEPDPARLMSAAAAALVGWWFRNTFFAILAGVSVLYLGLWLVG